MVTNSLPAVDFHRAPQGEVSREMASQTYSTLSEEQRETDKGSRVLNATMQPVVKLYRIGMQCFIYCALNL